MEENKNNLSNKLHAICIPFPIQGHITPMLQFAKHLNSKGFHITFFNTQHNHKCILNSKGPTALNGTPSFRYKLFSDGLPPSENDLPREVPHLLKSLEHDCLEPFLKVLLDLNQPSSGSPPITVIISDALIPFAVKASRHIPGCSVVYFTPASPSSFVAYSQYDTLLQRGTLPFKDPKFMTNGSLDMILDSVPPSMKGMKLKDLPSHVRTMDKNSPIFDYVRRLIARISVRPIIFNTFEAFDRESLADLSTFMAGPIFTAGPLNSLSVKSESGSTFWKEDSECLTWLDGRRPNSVVFASFGSTTLMTSEQFLEFAWGLANSKHPFLWAIRPDTVIGERAALPVEFENEIRGRGLIVEWCPQAEVLNHPAVGVFLTHCGWNSVLETVCSGVPVICWPYKADHQPISWWCCEKWGIGLEVSIHYDRDQVEKRIKEALETEIGVNMKKKAMEWKMLAKEAFSSSGSSTMDVNRFIDYVGSFKHKNNGSKLMELFFYPIRFCRRMMKLFVTKT
ncbi:hypothetical protein RND81_08G022900 [Saponaria officinalis]|uniref:Glycosyltransferase n=1 Tax=Saponaria officinalis TaxID=3572 RepID=A0AAW1J1V6_SAPOF